MQEYLIEVADENGSTIDQQHGDHFSELKFEATRLYGGKGYTFEVWSVMEDSSGNLDYVELVLYGYLDKD